MNKIKIAEAIELAKEHGLTSVEVDGIRFTIDQTVSKSQSVPDLKAEDIVSPEAILDQMSDDEIKYYATPYYDELQRKKQTQREIIKEDEATHV